MTKVSKFYTDENGENEIFRKVEDALLPSNNSCEISSQDDQLSIFGNDDESSTSNSSYIDYNEYHNKFEDSCQTYFSSTTSSEPMNMTTEQDYCNVNAVQRFRPETWQCYDVLFRPSIIKTIKESTIMMKDSTTVNSVIKQNKSASKESGIKIKEAVEAADKKIKIRKDNTRYESLVKRSRARRNINGYDAPTFLAEAKKVKKETKDKMENNQLKGISSKLAADQRRRHKQKLKQMLTQLEQSKQIENKTEMMEAEEAIKRR